jgi:hypothetical protein
MNRIILIGNGFDLAHGLETSYRSFIDDLWREKLKKHQTQINYVDDDIHIEGLKFYRNSLLPKFIDTYGDLEKYNEKRSINDGRLIVKCHNSFLEKITLKKQLTNWVDVENEYFKELLKLVNNTTDNESEIIKLNQDFSSIKVLLENYITKELKSKSESETLKKVADIYLCIYSNFYIEDFSKQGSDFLYKEIIAELNLMIENNKIPSFNENFEDIFNFAVEKGENMKLKLKEDKIKQLFKDHELAKRFIDLKPTNILFLNFNYTKVESIYSKYIRSDYNSNYYPKIENNHIHGELNNSNNPIIFGYGDEIGKDYAVIEDANNNDLLENVKSIRYLDTEKYKQLLEYIDSDKYQIFVMGHSCGNSDRTLLNTLYENKNCVSIKVFYHQINETEDNYSDVIRNISRNFNDKKMMREKVVNKTYCSPLVKK